MEEYQDKINENYYPSIYDLNMNKKLQNIDGIYKYRIKNNDNEFIKLKQKFEEEYLSYKKY